MKRIPGVILILACLAFGKCESEEYSKDTKPIPVKITPGCPDSSTNLLVTETRLKIYYSPGTEEHPFEHALDGDPETYWEPDVTGEVFVKLDASSLPGQEVSIKGLCIEAHNLGSAGVKDMSLEWKYFEGMEFPPWQPGDIPIITPCFYPITPENDDLITRKFHVFTRTIFTLTIPEGYNPPLRIGTLYIFPSLEAEFAPDLP